MFEDDKDGTRRRLRFSLMPDFPWVVRAYFFLLLAFFAVYIGLGTLAVHYGTPIFEEAMRKMLGFIELYRRGSNRLSFRCSSLCLWFRL